MTRNEFRQLITDRFSEDELKILCFDLDIDYESLRGEGKPAKVKELIEYCQRHGCISDLVCYLQHHRPKIPWSAPETRISTQIRHFWNKVLKPILKIITALASLIIPFGSIIWYLIYWIARNQDVFLESIVLIQLLVLPTISLSLYSLFWSIVIYPRFILPWFKKTAT